MPVSLGVLRPVNQYGYIRAKIRHEHEWNENDQLHKVNKNTGIVFELLFHVMHVGVDS